MMYPSVRSILVCGATGKQGGALIQSLLSAQKPESPTFHILALTRNPSSPSAQRLAAKPNLSIIQGDLNNCEAIFAAIPPAQKPVFGVFSVQLPAIGPFADHGAEERQGKALIEAALENDVKHFVYSSVDRGGPERSESDPTNIPHFISKYRVEKHLQIKAATTGAMTWTIIRTVAFFENIGRDFLSRVFVAIWRAVDGAKPFQFISTVDIGHIAALAFWKADDPEYRNKAIHIAGDVLNYEEANQIFQTEFPGEGNLPQTFGFVGSMVRHGVKEVRTMIDWLEESGAKASIEETRRRHPDVMDFGTWLENASEFKKQ